MSKSNLFPGFPIGSILEWPATTPPYGWVLCDGSSKLIMLHPQLFALIGYYYGGSGSNFNVPYLNGAILIGPDNMGGIPAGRINVFHSNPNTLGALGGEEKILLVESTTPPHTGNNVITNTNTYFHQHSFPHSIGNSSGAGPFSLQWVQDSGYISNYVTNAPGVNIENPVNNHPDTVSDSIFGGVKHNNMMPTLIMNPIIRYL